LPALIRKFHQAKINNEATVPVWGTGTPLREFLHADDVASACLFLMQQYEAPEIINIGVGKDHSIREMALMIKKVIGYTGELMFDATKPDGTLRKLLSVDKINALGWYAGIELEEGIQRTYEDFVNKYDYYTTPKKDKVVAVNN
jgi:GDP-L-fucose synthase